MSSAMTAAESREHRGEDLAKRYLELACIQEGIYIIGILDTGVTILSQQVRALNLIWALDTLGHLSTGTRVAVVGGGIAGLTAASAIRTVATRNGHSRTTMQGNLTVFEKRSVLCPLQRGCDMRWVHPHAYNWPSEGSENPSANLPLLNWRANRASDVAARIVKEWERLGDSPQSLKVTEVRALRYLTIDSTLRRIEWVGEVHSDGSSSKITGEAESFDLIILAVGYGDELVPRRYRSAPYWRNETHGQPDLTGPPKNYMISGTGDGGLTDLFRIRITDFRQDRISTDLVDASKSSADFLQCLRELYGQCYLPALADSQWGDFFEKCRKIGRDFSLTEHVRQRLRSDTKAELVIRGGSTIADVIRGKSSFLNKFLAVLLFEAGGFTPLFGELESQERQVGCQVLVRHGPRPKQHLQALFSNQAAADLAIEKLEKRLEREKLAVGYDGRLWEPGWPFYSEKEHQASAKRAYVPDATIALATAFVAALRPVLSRAGGNYRVTLHRLIAFELASPAPGGIPKEYHLQQIAHYQGPRAAPKTEEDALRQVGRLFKPEDALIGLCARTRKILVTRRNRTAQDEQEFFLALAEDMGSLGGQRWDPHHMDIEVRSLFACPFLHRANGKSHTAQEGVVAVLFADSTALDAFDDRTIGDIVEASQGFCDYLEKLAESRSREVAFVVGEASAYVAAPTGDALSGLTTLISVEIQPPEVSFNHLNFEWKG